MTLSEIRFEARIEMASGRRVYTKSVEVGNIQLRRWSTPDGSIVRCYVTAEADGYTSSQNGRYTLGWIDANGRMGGQRRGEPFNWGDATEEQRSAIIEAAQQMLAEEEAR